MTMSDQIVLWILYFYESITSSKDFPDFLDHRSFLEQRSLHFQHQQKHMTPQVQSRHKKLKKKKQIQHPIYLEPLPASSIGSRKKTSLSNPEPMPTKWTNLWNDAPRERRSQNLKASRSVKDVEYQPPLDMSFIHLLNTKVHTCVHVSINGDISLCIYIYIRVCIN